MLAEEFLTSAYVISQDAEGPSGRPIKMSAFYCNHHTLSFDLGERTEGVKK